MKIKSLEIDEKLDHDGELEIMIENCDRGDNHEWFTVEELIQIRDHLNKLIGE